MTKANYHKRAIYGMVEKYLSTCPAGYVITSPNLLFDLKLDTEDSLNDDYVYKALCNIKQTGALKKHGKTLEEIDYSKKFSRGNKRATKVYKIIESV